jgi:FHS family glucose/mannose:H+ symporter-like MFS transporter
MNSPVHSHTTLAKKSHRSTTLGRPAASRPAYPRRIAAYAGLHLGFALTGAYSALIGAALPLVSEHWRLHDDRSGALFLAQFLGSMSGALLRAPRLLPLVAAGFVLVGLTCVALAHVPAVAALAVIFLYGVGLGTAMTSTSVWMNARFAGSGSALESLNAVWAAGAGAVPWLVLPWVHPATLGRFLEWISLPAFAFALWLFFWSRSATSLEAADQPATSPEKPADAPLLLALILGFLSFGAVGVESALGGWMTTYVARAGQAGALSASGAASGFWFGLLGSRILASLLLLGWVSPAMLLAGSLLLATAGLAMLVLTHSPWLLLVCAAACGAGIGPIYPLVLTFALRLFRGRWMFVTAGLGAASLPWFTGMVSRSAGSLRIGLGIPLLMLFAMAAALTFGMRRPSGTKTATPPEVPGA